MVTKNHKKKRRKLLSNDKNESLTSSSLKQENHQQSHHQQQQQQQAKRNDKTPQHIRFGDEHEQKIITPSESLISNNDDNDDCIKETKNTIPSRKRKSEAIKPEKGDNGEDNNVIRVHQRRKKSKKKKSKKHKKSSNTTSHENDQQNPTVSTYTSTTTTDSECLSLEGKMVNDQLVLIDRINKKVYSAVERDPTKKYDNDYYLQIGHLDTDGTIVIDQSNNVSKFTTENNDNTTLHDNGTNTDSTTTTTTPIFSFPTDPDDHCESPIQAYQDIQPLLQYLAKNQKNNVQGQLSIYDPYYCNGAVKKHLASLGFPNVYNENEDCYQVWDNDNKHHYPNFDVLVTNPPYSANHIEKLITHLTCPKSLFSSNNSNHHHHPWFLLLPEWVHKKDYYLDAIKHYSIQPFYLVPRKRYVYLPPKSFRQAKKSDVHKKSSPFVSMWYIWGGTMQQTNKLIAIAQQQQKYGNNNNYDVARSKSALRDLRRQKRK